MENYEKKYKNALEWARQVMNGKTGFIRDEVLDVFPELKDNDDRIRKVVIFYFKNYKKQEEECGISTFYGIPTDDILAWLEKQESVEEIVARCKDSWYNEGKIQGQIEGLTDEEKYQQGWHDALEKQVPVDKDKVAKGVKRGVATSLINYIDANSKGMCLSNMECEDIEDAIVNGKWYKVYNYMKKKLEEQGEKPQGKTAFEAIKEKPADNANKVEPKFKIKLAGKEYNVLEIKESAGVTFYGIEDEPNHIDYVLSDNCEIISGYGEKEKGSPYPTKSAIFSEQNSAWSESDEEEFQIAIDILVAAGQRDSAHWLESIKQRIGG